MALIIRLPHTHGNNLIPRTFYGSSLGSNASIAELGKMTHVIDKLLSADSTVPTET